MTTTVVVMIEKKLFVGLHNWDHNSQFGGWSEVLLGVLGGRSQVGVL